MSVAAEAGVRAKSSGLAQVAAISAFAAFAIGGISGFLFFAAAGFDPAAIVDPSLMLDQPASSAALFRWMAVTDMLGYYLLLVPLFLAVGARLRRRAGELVDLYSLGGLVYALIGASAAAVLATAGSGLLELHATASGATQDAAAVGFVALTDAVFFGAWQMLDVIGLGAWAVGTGSLFWRSRRGLGAIGLALGVVSWLGAVLGMLGVTGGLGAWLLPLAISFGVLFWAYMLWLAVLLLRDAELLPAAGGSLTTSSAVRT